MKFKMFSVFTRRFTYALRNEVRRTYSTELKSFKSIPGLSAIPVLGPLHHFLPVVGTIGMKPNFYEMTAALHEKFGPIVKMEGIFARANMVFIYEPELYEPVYRSEDEGNPLRPGFETNLYYREVLRKETFQGIHGLTTAQGEKWRDFRTKVNPALLKPKIIKLYAAALDEIASDMVDRIIKLKDDRDYLKNHWIDEMTKFSLESIALVGLGTRLGCLRDDLPDDHPAKQMTQIPKIIFDLSFKLELLPSLWKYIEIPSFKKLMKAYDMQWELIVGILRMHLWALPRTTQRQVRWIEESYVPYRHVKFAGVESELKDKMNSFIDVLNERCLALISKMYIEQAQKRIEERGHDIPDEDKSVLERLLAIDERVALMMANEMLLAGIDTVSLITTSLLYQFAKNPEVQEKARQEILSDAPQKRYLRACIKEGLRILPVVSAHLRRTTRDHVVAGYHIPKGTDVVAPNEYLSKSEKFYPRAKEFIPERWLAEKDDPLYYGNTHPMITMPFGFGIRTCIGRRIAELEIEAMLKIVLSRLIVKWEGPPIKVTTIVLNSFVKPYNFKFEVLK